MKATKPKDLGLMINVPTEPPHRISACAIKMNDLCVGEILKSKKLKKPLTIEPEETLREALRIMACNRFSQLPVVQKSTNRCLGLLSYKSIVKQIQLIEDLRRQQSEKVNLLTLPVKHFTDPSPIFVSESDTIFELFRSIKNEDAVLVGKKREEPSYVVTNYDIVEIIEEMSDAFLLIQQIETSIRSIIKHQLQKHNQSFSSSAQKVNEALEASGCKTLLPLGTLEEMTMDNYIIFITNADNFRALFFEVFNDKNTVKDRLEFVRKLRNDVFHFRRLAYSLKEDEIKNLKKIDEWLKTLV